MKKPWFTCLVISLSVAFLLGGLVMWMAWQHNSQCEIHCAEQGLDWAYWLTFGAGGGDRLSELHAAGQPGNVDAKKVIAKCACPVWVEHEKSHSGN